MLTHTSLFACFLPLPLTPLLHSFQVKPFASSNSFVFHFRGSTLEAGPCKNGWLDCATWQKVSGLLLWLWLLVRLAGWLVAQFRRKKRFLSLLLLIFVTFFCVFACPSHHNNTAAATGPPPRYGQHLVRQQKDGTEAEEIAKGKKGAKTSSG